MYSAKTFTVGEQIIEPQYFQASKTEITRFAPPAHHAYTAQ